MRIVVCIKQVPETTTVKIDPITNTLIRDGVPSIINPFDTSAIEAGLQLKDKYCAEIIILTMGPPQAEDVLREALSLGADEAVLVSDRAFAGADTLATSYTLSMAIKKIGDVSLVLCGKQAIDGDTGQVGPELAEILEIANVSYVRKVCEFNQNSHNTMIVERVLDDGYEVIKVELPSLFTIVREMYEPRMPSLKGKMAAKKKGITIWNAQDLGVLPDKIGLKGSPTQVIKTFTLPPRMDREILKGETREIVKNLVEKIKERKVI